jgi:PAS domain S-box-containing protein
VLQTIRRRRAAENRQSIGDDVISGDTTWALPPMYDARDPAAAPVVVIVEDDADTRANLQDILELDGFQVETAATAVELRGRKNWENVAATLLDRRLPDGDALEVIPYLKSVAPRSAIVVITGYADVDSAVTALRLGTADYILKPINPEALRASLRRIAEQRHADQALRDSRAQLRTERDFVESLIETVPSAVVLLDAQGKIIRFNRWLQEASGYCLDDVKGDDWFERFVQGVDRDAIKQVFEKVLAAGGIVEHTNQIVARDGRHIEIRWFSKAMRGPDQALIGVLASGQDVTALRRAQEKAVQSERLAAVGQAMAGLVHESRNALQRCLACTELLAAELEGHADAMTLIARIQRAQNDLHLLFEEVRQYAAPILLHRGACELRELYKRAWEDLAPQHREKRLTFQEQCDSTSCSCDADAFRLSQVFRNVLENALQASPLGAAVSIECRRVDFNGEPAFCLRFRDQGAGVPIEDRSRILEPFYTTKAKGTGLGMAICKRIIDAHGGAISIGEAPDGGAEIAITIPQGASGAN